MKLAQLILLSLTFLAAPAPAQVDTPPFSRSVRVLAHTFTTPSLEFVRVRLNANENYRAQLDRAGLNLEVRPVSERVQPPRLRRLSSGDNLTLFIIEPRVTAEYEIRVLGAGEDQVRLRVDRRARQQ